MQVLGTDAARQPGGVVYRHGEDERLAPAVLAILKRDDLDDAAVKRWLAQLGQILTAARSRVIETLRRM